MTRQVLFAVPVVPLWSIEEQPVIDWSNRKAAWCAIEEGGELAEGMLDADQDGLAQLVHQLGQRSVVVWR